VKSRGVAIKGTTTNDNASTGFLGELISSNVTFTNFPTSTQWGDLTSVSLSAGDWDVSVGVQITKNTATWTEVDWGISTTSANSSTGMTIGVNRFYWYTAAGLPVTEFTGAIPTYRVSLSSTTTVYLKMTSTYSAGQPQIEGVIRARRIR